MILNKKIARIVAACLAVIMICLISVGCNVARSSDDPTTEPTSAPATTPTSAPTSNPTEAPTNQSESTPTEAPTNQPAEEPTEQPTDDQRTYGNEVGNLCYPFDVETYSGETVGITSFSGKVTVINFWGTWCPYCIHELPDFDTIASEYADSAVIITVDSDSDAGEAYMRENFPNTKIVTVKDTANQDCFELLGGTKYYPRTVILDEDGVIVYAADGAMSYWALKNIIDAALAE